MGFFDNTKHFFERKREEKAEGQKVVKSKKQVKINHKDEMSSVLDETEVQSALSNMSKEPKLRAHDPEDETKPMYIAMKLDAKDIGGISIRRRKDKTIGQLVEAIKANRIMAYIPEELMAMNQLLIIPTPSTLDAMSDFTVLTSDNLKYELAVVIPDGRGKATIGFADNPCFVTYNIMREYVTDDDTNTPNQFLDQFHFFDEAVSETDNQSNTDNVDDSAKKAAQIASNKKVKLDDIPDDTKSDPDVNKSTSTADVLKNSESESSEGSNASTVGQDDFTDSSTPFTMGGDGEPNFGNSNPTEKDNSGDVDVPSSQEQDDGGVAPEDDPVTAGLNLGNKQNQDQNEANDQSQDNSAEDESDDFASEDDDQNTNDFTSQDDSVNDLDDDDDQTQDDFGGITEVDNNGADNLAKAQANSQSQQNGDKPNVPATDEQLDEAIERRFYGNNLNLKVTTKPIDLLLMNNNDIVPFDTDRGEGFLNQYLNQMSREANQSLLRKHNDNIAATRTFWYNLVVKGVEDIVSKVDDTNKDTDYGKRKLELDANKDVAISNAKAEAKPELDKMDKDLEDAAKADAQRAYNQAQQDYLDRFRGKTEASKEQLLNRKLDEVMSDYNDKLKRLQDSESSYASQMYDQLVSDSTTSAMNYYKKLRNNEHKSEQEWRRKLRTYTDHHRKEQVAHDKALQAEIDQERESQEQKKQFDSQMKKLTSQMAMQKKESNDKIKQLEAQNAQDLDTLRKENKDIKRSYEQKLADRDVKHSREIADMKREYETKLNGLREEKQERITQLNSDHAAQLTQMRNDNEVKIEQLKHEKDARLRDIQAHNQDKVDNLTQQIHDLTQEIKRSQEAKDQRDKLFQHQMEQKDELVKNLRDEITNLNDDLSHVQGRAEDHLRGQMEAKYTGQLEMLKELNNNLKDEISRQKDESKTRAASSKSSARSLAMIAAVFGALLGIGGSLLFIQSHSQSIQANLQAQIRQAQEEQKSKDDAKLDDAINRAIDRVQSQNAKNDSSSDMSNKNSVKGANNKSNKSNKSNNSNK